MSALQTGRVMPEGDFRLFVGGGFFQTPEVSPAEVNRISFPYLEGGGRFGFTQGWDIGAKYTLPGMITGDVKFNVFENETTAFAMGLAVGYLATPASTAGTPSQFTEPILDIIIPFIVSYDFSEVFGVYASPRYVMRVQSSQKDLVGGAAGIRVGNKLGVFVEAGGAKDLRSNYSQLQASFGVFFGSGPSVPPKAVKE